MKTRGTRMHTPQLVLDVVSVHTTIVPLSNNPFDMSDSLPTTENGPRLRSKDIEFYMSFVTFEVIFTT